MDQIPWWIVAIGLALKYGVQYLEVTLKHREKMKEIETQKVEDS